MDEETCTCEGECVCDQVKAMMSELDSIRVINRGFRATPHTFDVGPGAAVSTGEQLVNIYFWDPAKGRDLSLSQEPAMTIGLPKDSAAKLLWCLTATARDLGWVDEGDEEDE